MRIEFNNYEVPVWPMAVILLAGIVAYRWQKDRCLPRAICELVFGGYLLLAVDRVFFPLRLSGNYVDTMRAMPILSAINLVPFSGINAVNFSYAMQGFLLNIFLTIPFGFGIRFVVRIRKKDMVWWIMGGGLGIECSQLILNLVLGYQARVVDINDTICNLIGVAIGYGLFLLLSNVYRRHPFKNENEWGDYLHQMLDD